MLWPHPSCRVWTHRHSVLRPFRFYFRSRHERRDGQFPRMTDRSILSSSSSIRHWPAYDVEVPIALVVTWAFRWLSLERRNSWAAHMLGSRSIRWRHHWIEARLSPVHRPCRSHTQHDLSDRWHRLNCSSPIDVGHVCIVSNLQFVTTIELSSTHSSRRSLVSPCWLCARIARRSTSIADDCSTDVPGDVSVRSRIVSYARSSLLNECSYPWLDRVMANHRGIVVEGLALMLRHSAELLACVDRQACRHARHWCREWEYVE